MTDINETMMFPDNAHIIEYVGRRSNFLIHLLNEPKVGRESFLVFLGLYNYHHHPFLTVFVAGEYTAQSTCYKHSLAAYWLWERLTYL